MSNQPPENTSVPSSTPFNNPPQHKNLKNPQDYASKNETELKQIKSDMESLIQELEKTLETKNQENAKAKQLSGVSQKHLNTRISHEKSELEVKRQELSTSKQSVAWHSLAGNSSAKELLMKLLGRINNYANYRKAYRQFHNQEKDITKLDADLEALQEKIAIYTKVFEDGKVLGENEIKTFKSELKVVEKELSKQLKNTAPPSDPLGNAVAGSANNQPNPQNQNLNPNSP